MLNLVRHHNLKLILVLIVMSFFTISHPVQASSNVRVNLDADEYAVWNGQAVAALGDYLTADEIERITDLVPHRYNHSTMYLCESDTALCIDITFGDGPSREIEQIDLFDADGVRLMRLTLLVTVNNVKVTGDLSYTNYKNVGILEMINVVEPSTEDAQAGYRYSYDCDTSDRRLDRGGTANKTFPCFYPGNGVYEARVTIWDRNTSRLQAYSVTQSVVIDDYDVDVDASQTPRRVNLTKSLTLNEYDSFVGEPILSAADGVDMAYAVHVESTQGHVYFCDDYQAICLDYTAGDNALSTFVVYIYAPDGKRYVSLIVNLQVVNVPATAQFTYTIEESAKNVALIEVTDIVEPSQEDRTRGFVYGFDCNADGVLERISRFNTFECVYRLNGDYNATISIWDKDTPRRLGTTYTSTVTVEGYEPPLRELPDYPHRLIRIRATDVVVNEYDQVVQLQMTNTDEDLKLHYADRIVSTSGNAYICPENDNAICWDYEAEDDQPISRQVIQAYTAVGDRFLFIFFALTVENVTPEAELIYTRGVGDDFVTLQLINIQEPSLEDREAGLRYAFDCDDRGAIRSNIAPDLPEYVCPLSQNGEFTMRAAVGDKDTPAYLWNTYSVQVPVDGFVTPIQLPDRRTNIWVRPTVTEYMLFDDFRLTDPTADNLQLEFAHTIEATAGHAFLCEDNTAICWDYQAGDGPGFISEQVQVYAPNGFHYLTIIIRARVTNIAPQAEFITTVDGNEVTLAFINVDEPSADDMSAGINYQFDCDMRGISMEYTSDTPEYTCVFPEEGTYEVRARITDKDMLDVDASIVTQSIQIQPDTDVTPTEPTEVTPTEPTPTEVTPTEPTPTEVTPTEPTPTEPTPTEVTPTEPTPIEPTPTEPTPTEVTPTEPTPTEVTPTEPTPTEVTPTEPTPTEPTPTEVTPTEPPPTEPTPTEVTPTEPTPTEPTPTEPTPTEPTPTEVTPTEPTPTEVTPTEVTPTEPTPTYDVNPVDVCWVENRNNSETAWRVTNDNPVPLPGTQAKVLFDWAVYRLTDNSNPVQMAYRWDQTPKADFNTPLVDRILVRWYVFDNGNMGTVYTVEATATDAHRCEDEVVVAPVGENGAVDIVPTTPTPPTTPEPVIEVTEDVVAVEATPEILEATPTEVVPTEESAETTPEAVSTDTP